MELQLELKSCYAIAELNINFDKSLSMLINTAKEKSDKSFQEATGALSNRFRYLE